MEAPPICAPSLHDSAVLDALLLPWLPLTAQVSLGSLSHLWKRAIRQHQCAVGAVDLAEHISDASLRYVSQRYPHLRSLALSRRGDVRDAAYAACLCILKRDSNLRACARLGDAAILQLCQSCPELAALDLSSCSMLRASTLCALAQTCPGLRHLDVSYCLVGECASDVDRAVEAVARSCPSLESIDLMGVKVTVASMQALAASAVSLRKLRVGSIALDSDAGDAALRSLARGCAHLEVLDLFSCEFQSDAAVQEVIASLRHLHTLHLSRCVGLSDAVLHTIAQRCPSLQALHLLQRDEPTTSIGSLDALRAMAAGCRSLLHLDLSYVPMVDEGVACIARCCTRLRQLFLFFCGAGVTDGSLMELGAHCAMLEALDCSGCVNLAGECALEAIATGCSRLFSLGLAACNQLCDDGVTHLAARCGPRLLRLNLSCTDITDRALHAIAAHCIALQRLDLGACSSISGDAARRVQSCCPHLHTLAGLAEEEPPSSEREEANDSVTEVVAALEGIDHSEPQG